jgi:hydrogenase maturation protease
MGRMLIAGVGNIFLSDDGFGVEVAGRLARADLPGWVRVADYGISGLHLAYDLAEGYETTILIDAAARGDVPGTVYVIEPDLAPANRGNPLLDAHGMQPDVVFGMLDLLGADAGRVLVVGCEPASVEEGIGLSPPVMAAVDEAVRIVLDLVHAAEGRTGADSGAADRQQTHPAPAGPPAAGGSR